MTETFTNADVAKKFRTLADLLEIGGMPVFRVAAYRRAAESIESLPEAVAALKRRGELQSIPGVGKGIADHINELFNPGTMLSLEEAQREVPIGVTELLTVPEIGPKRARQLFQHAGIASLAQLKEAVAAGALVGVPGLGPKGAQRIADALRTMVAPDDRMPLPLARRLGLDLIALLRERVPQLEQIELAGSIRRFRETVGDLDIVAAWEDPASIVEVFAALPVVTRIEMQGENRCRVILQNGQAADLRVLPKRHWGSLLHHFTGSKHHNVKLRDLANDRGWSMSEYGFRRGDELIACATEEEVYAFFEMDVIPPPMREETGEIERALAHTLPAVIGFDGIRGDLHMHSTWSDGTRSIEEMARQAMQRGYEYLCITDHSRGLGVANGLDAERLMAQRVEIDAVNAAIAPFRVLQGVEVEVLTDGALDLPDEVLARLDLTIGSVHSGIRRGVDATTGRSIKAMQHPLIDILAHPTGRVLGGRGAGDFDMERIIAAAVETGTALEINGSRVDLNDV
ncbi:MAG: DNA polymerase/3'-5' exonuclease PolX, partial [Thermomicrobiales bacterium]|nr:DNA polymerase/3'-5' exonuclease PolX [Thermomicrobiales bacterium]